MSSKILQLTDAILRRSQEKVSGNTVVGFSFEIAQELPGAIQLLNNKFHGLSPSGGHHSLLSDQEFPKTRDYSAI